MSRKAYRDFTENYEKLIQLLSYRHDEGAATPITSQETIYETFAKSVGLYNGKAKLARTPWPEMLKTQGIPSTKQVEDGDGNKDYLKLCFSCKYTIQVRNVRFGLPYRQYIWIGGVYPATKPNPDAGKEGQPDTIPHPYANQTWCFGYGEKEWINGVSYTRIRNQSKSTSPLGLPQKPIGQINCNTGEKYEI